jgi:predicted aspartyl protease
VPSDHAKKLAAAGQPIPASVTGVALIDTGASSSCIDIGVATKLGLVAINQASVHTPGGPATQSVFAVRMEFTGCTLKPLDSWFVLGSQLTSLGAIAGAPLVALLGRDYLGGAVLVYNGPIGAWLIGE